MNRLLRLNIIPRLVVSRSFCAVTAAPVAVHGIKMPDVMVGTNMFAGAMLLLTYALFIYLFICLFACFICLLSNHRRRFRSLKQAKLMSGWCLRAM